MTDVRLMTFDPGHFHAALVQKEMPPGASRRVHVYAPLGPDLLAHLARIQAFNSRANEPTAWEMEVHACPNALERLIAEKPGNVVVFSGRNRGKIDGILAALQVGLHVLADKPWVIRSSDMPKLEQSLDLAERRGLVALDIMTERHEVTSQLQRELIRNPEVFGAIDPGSEDRPSVFMESEHYLCKTVAGAPLRRPAWFFDVEQAGEGLADVGTHLVDLVPWLLFPDQPISRAEVRLLKAGRVPTLLGKADFQRITGLVDFPPFLADRLVSGQFPYYCNNTVSYAVRGVHVWLNVAWGVEAGPGMADRHFARVRGTLASIEVRQGAVEQYRPEVYIVPRESALKNVVKSAVSLLLQSLQPAYPGVAVDDLGETLRLSIPNALRIGHEAHFGEVTRLFLGYLADPTRLPAWEKANLLAKYHVTTSGVQLARSR